jgi:hypothetical protein
VATVNIEIQKALLRHQVDLLRLEAGTRTRAINAINQMTNELYGMLTDKDITKFSKSRITALLSQAEDTINRYYGRIQDFSDRTLEGAAQVSAKYAGKTLDATFIGIDMEASLPSVTVLEKIAGDALIMGATTDEWWERQARDTAFRFSNAVRQGLVAGDTTEKIAARVAGRQGFPGVMEVSRANARSLVHTAIMEVANESRMSVFQKNDDIIEGVRQVSTLDSNTTDICMAYDGAEFDLEGEPINDTELPYEGGCPRHWGCRSVEVPITKTFKQLGVDAPEPDAGTRASEGGQVSARMTFGDFLDTLSEEKQNEMLGEGRAELWRAGDITLQQLLDQKGNPLTLKELEKRYG